MTSTKREFSVGAVFIAMIAAVGGGAACGGAPTLVMYDTKLEAQLALQLHDEQGHPLEVSDAFALADDLLVVANRIVGEECRTGLVGAFGVPYHECWDHKHGFVARVTRGGDVLWSLAATGSNQATCNVDATLGDAGLRVTAGCNEGAELGGAQLFDNMIDPATGEVVGPAVEPLSTPYDFIEQLDDGTSVGVFSGTVSRGTLNENGVLVNELWSRNIGDETGYLDVAGLHVLGDEVLVAGHEGVTYDQIRFFTLALDSGERLETDVRDARNVWPSANGWWSIPGDIKAHTMQHRDATGAVDAETEPGDFPYVMSASSELLWVALQNGSSPITPVRVDLP